MGARFLDDEARRAFKQAIETIEGASGVEVVVALRRQSAGYLHANLIAGVVAVFAALAVMLFSHAEFGLMAILIDPFIAGVVVSGLVHWLPPVKRVLTHPRTRRRYVAHAAKAAFVERGVHNTRDRSGLLLYISWLEQEIALVADSGLLAAWTPEAVAAAEAKLTAAMPRGGVVLARELATFASALGVAIPRREGDINELPDDIDSEYHPRESGDDAS